MRGKSQLPERRQRECERLDVRWTRRCARAATARRRPRSRTDPPPARAGSRCTARHSCTLYAQVGDRSSQPVFKRRTESQGAGSAPFGCHISVRNFILGGRSGKSGGKVMTARRNAPSYSESGGLFRGRVRVPAEEGGASGGRRGRIEGTDMEAISTFAARGSGPGDRASVRRHAKKEGSGGTDPKMVISHSKMLSSSTSPAEKPSTGCLRRSAVHGRRARQPWSVDS